MSTGSPGGAQMAAARGFDRQRLFDFLETELMDYDKAMETAKSKGGKRKLDYWRYDLPFPVIMS